jgi:GNAT superfamily N-acetyltransferase
MLKMYALDLDVVIPRVKPLLPVRYAMHQGRVRIDTVAASTQEQRVAKGDRIFVAYIKHQPVAYLFAAMTDTWVGEVEDWLNIPAREVYLYDAYTAADYRGRRIYPFLMTAAARYFKKHAYRFALIFSTAENMDSVRGIERCGFKCYETVDYRNFLGLKSWHYRLGERHVKARLGNEN